TIARFEGFAYSLCAVPWHECAYIPQDGAGSRLATVAAKKKRASRMLRLTLSDPDGRGGGIRTRDPLLPKQMRYQAALRPDVPLAVTSSGEALYPRRGAPSGRLAGGGAKF